MGTSTISDMVMARCVPSRSTAWGRDGAWKYGAVWPARSSSAVSQAMQSEFSACTMTMAPSRRASASTEMICRSLSLRVSYVM